MDNTNVIKKNRIEWLDVARGICLILMITTHSFGSRRWGYFNGICGLFFLVFFYLSAGLCFKSSIPFRQYIKKQFKKLIIPYVLFSILFYGVIFFRWNMYSGDLKANILRILVSFIYSYCNVYVFSMQVIAAGPLWFLTSLFVALTLYRALYSLKWKGIWVILIAAAAIVSQKYITLPFAFQAGCIGCMFVWIGDISKDKWFSLADWAEKSSNIKLCLAILGSLIVMLLILGIIIRFFPDKDLLDLSSNHYSFLSLPCSLIGFVIVILCAVLCIRTKIVNDFLEFYGKNSFSLLVLHSIDINMLRSFGSSSLTFLFATVMAYPVLLIVFRRVCVFAKPAIDKVKSGLQARHE